MRLGSSRSNLAPILVVALTLSGCLEPDTSTCGDRICPSGRMCHAATGTCVQPVQLAECVTQPNGTTCLFPGVDGDQPGACTSGACLEARCGDGYVSASEDCEPDVPVSRTCSSFGFYDDAPIPCTTSCRFDLSRCTGFCGDGQINGPEDCENGSVGENDCTVRGFYQPGGLTCTAHCAFDTSACRERCGDGVRNGLELCDGFDVDNARCVVAGFDRGSTTCGVNCAAQTSACARIGFVAETNAPGSILHTMWAFGPNDVWAAGGTGASGTILHYDGTAWATTTVPTHVRAMWGLRPDYIIAVGDSGGVLHFDGSSWTSASSAGSFDLAAVHGTAENDVWAVQQFGSLFHDDGTGWRLIATPDVVSAVWTAPGVTVIATASGVFTYNGSGWDSALLTATNSVWGRSATDIYAGTAAGLYHFDGSWQRITEVPAQAVTVRGGDATRLYFGIGGSLGSGGTLARLEGGDVSYYDWRDPAALAVAGDLLAADGDQVFRYAGASWLLPAPAGELVAIHGTGSSAIAVGRNGRVSHYTNGAWLDATAPTTDDFTSVWVIDADNAVATTSTAIYRYAGGTWTEDATGFTGLADVWGTTMNNLWAVGAGGNIWHYTNTWTHVLPRRTTADYVSIYGTADADFYASAGGTVWHYQTGAWTSAAVTAFASELWASAIDDVYTVAPKGVFHLNGAWSASPTPTSWYPLAVTGTGVNDVTVVGRYLAGTGFVGKFNGTSWSLADSENVDFRSVWMSAADETFAVSTSASSPLWGGAHDGELGPIRAHTLATLSAVFGVDKIAYAVGERGTIVRVADGTWIVEPSPVNDTLHGVWTDGTVALAVGDNGRVLRRTVSTWSEIAGAPTVALSDVSARSASDVYIVGAAGTVLHFDGTTLVAESTGSTADLYGVYVQGGEVVAVGTEGTILRRDQSGWSAVPSPTTATLRDVWIGASGLRIAVGDGGTILRDDDDGDGFKRVPMSIADDFAAVSGASESDLFAVTTRGAILHDDGSGWGAVRAPRPSRLRGVWTDSRNTYLVGTKGTMMQLEREFPW